MYLLPLPAELRQASPFPLFMVMVIAFSFYRVWFFDKTRGNVPLMIVHHAAINLFALLLNGADRDVIAWVIPVAWLLAGSLLLATGGLSNRLTPGEADRAGFII